MSGSDTGPDFAAEAMACKSVCSNIMLTFIDCDGIYKKVVWPEVEKVYFGVLSQSLFPC